MSIVKCLTWRLPCRSGPPVDGPKDPWPRVLSLPERFVPDPASLARDIILGIINKLVANRRRLEKETRTLRKH